MGIFPEAKSFLFISNLFLQITVCRLNHMFARDMIRCGGLFFLCLSNLRLHMQLLCNLRICMIVKISGALRLMDCLPSSSDKKTLKRWFFIDKRVG